MGKIAELIDRLNLLRNCPSSVGLPELKNDYGGCVDCSTEGCIKCWKAALDPFIPSSVYLVVHDENGVQAAYYDEQQAHKYAKTHPWWRVERHEVE